MKTSHFQRFAPKSEALKLRLRLQNRRGAISTLASFGEKRLYDSICGVLSSTSTFTHGLAVLTALVTSWGHWRRFQSMFCPNRQTVQMHDIIQTKTLFSVPVCRRQCAGTLRLEPVRRQCAPPYIRIRRRTGRNGALVHGVPTVGTLDLAH